MLPAAVLIWDEPNLRKQSPVPDKAGNGRRALPPKRRTLPQASGATLRCALAGRCRSSTAMFPMLKITVPPDDREFHLVVQHDEHFHADEERRHDGAYRPKVPPRETRARRQSIAYCRSQTEQKIVRLVFERHEHPTHRVARKTQTERHHISPQHRILAL